MGRFTPPDTVEESRQPFSNSLSNYNFLKSPARYNESEPRLSPENTFFRGPVAPSLCPEERGLLPWKAAVATHTRSCLPRTVDCTTASKRGRVPFASAQSEASFAGLPWRIASSAFPEDRFRAVADSGSCQVVVGLPGPSRRSPHPFPRPV
jgi:hypothetical protein